MESISKAYKAPKKSPLRDVAHYLAGLAGSSKALVEALRQWARSCTEAETEILEARAKAKASSPLGPPGIASDEEGELVERARAAPPIAPPP